MTNEKIDKIRNAPAGFCLAKWYQVTIDLSRGYTHSCHHPERHKIPLEEIQKDPSALHNTYYKMLQRKMMLEGQRPLECDYCWKIEDTPGEHISDRFIKSIDNWAYDLFDETFNLPWTHKVSPTYVEVIFSSDCNLNCAYCSADVSSSIAREMEKFGPYPKIKNTHRVQNVPEIKDNNPYVEAFWKWFPEIVPTLRNFRITGGEPLLSKNTFKVLDYLEEHPAPNLTLAVNTNLSYSSVQLQRFLAQVKVLLAKKAIKSFGIFTSLDGFGEQAAYIRRGLDIEKFKENINLIASTLPETEIVLMCTYNILSITSFRNFIHWVKDLKKSGVKITLDIAYLNNPTYLAPNLADLSLRAVMNDDLEFLKSLPEFSNYEIQKYERIVSWVNSVEISKKLFPQMADFHRFISEYDRRFNSNFLETFPDYQNFMNTCKKSNTWFGVHLE